MTTRTRRSAAVLTIVLVLIAGVAGCVNIPSSGIPELVQPSVRASAPPVQVRVAPPPQDASAADIITGFMAAMANYQPNYEVAREYLAPEVRDAWRPEAGVRITANNVVPTITEDSAVLNAPLVGQIGQDNSYEGAGGTIRHNFKLVKDGDGQWRIGAPPEGLIITEYDFEQSYREMNLYFLEPGLSFLVPDPIYLPVANLTSSSLARRLSTGPTEWLRPGVVSMLSDKVAISSVVVGDDQVAQVALGDGALALSDQQRSLMVAQVTWTLRQLSTISAVRFTVNDTPYVVVPGGGSQTVAVDATSDFSPVEQQVSTQLFGARYDGLVRLDDTNERRDPVPVDGPLGQLPGIEDLAISPDGNQAAVVTGTRTQLQLGVIGDRQPVTVQAGSSELSRPQFTRFGELFVQGRKNGQTVLWAIREETADAVPVDLPKGWALVASRISPDGMRAAVVVEDAAGKDHLGLMLVTRSGAPRLVSFQEVGLKPSRAVTLESIDDVVWTSATDLAVLAAQTADDQSRPYVLGQDGTELAPLGGGSESWQAIRLTATQRRGEPTGTGQLKVAMVGDQGTAWRYADVLSWVTIGDDISAVTYPG